MIRALGLLFTSSLALAQPLTTAKVGSAMTANTYRFASSLQLGNFIKVLCYDGAAYESDSFAMLHAAYADGGAYPVPQSVTLQKVNYSYTVVFDAAAGYDKIDIFYSDAGSHCVTMGWHTIEPPGGATTVTRMGPRLGLTTDAQGKADVFVVIPAASVLNHGLYWIQVGLEGAGLPGSWSQIASVDDSGTPIAAARSKAFANYQPIVVARKDATHLSVNVMNQAGTGFTELQSAALPAGVIGNSIAIVQTDPVPVGIRTFLEWIWVPSSDGNLYGLRLLRQANTLLLTGWTQKPHPANIPTFDFPSDSLTGVAWHDGGGVNFQSLYMRGGDGRGYTLDADRNGAGGTWVNFDSGPDWPANDVFHGYGSALHTGADPFSYHEVHWLCRDNNTDKLCKLTRSSGGVDFSWLFF